MTSLTTCCSPAYRDKSEGTACAVPDIETGRPTFSPPSFSRFQQPGRRTRDEGRGPTSGHEKALLARRLAGLHFSISRMADRKTEGKGKEPEWEYESKGAQSRGGRCQAFEIESAFLPKPAPTADHRRGEDPNAVCPSDCSLRAVSANCFGT